MFVNVHEYTIRDGDAGIDETVAAMFYLIRRGAGLPIVRDTARELVGMTPPGATWAETLYRRAAVLRAWVQDHWQFTEDPAWAEVLYGADAQLGIIHAHGAMFADCDDAAILLGALGLAAGLAPRILCVGFLTPDAPYTHTWVELRPPLGAGAWLEGDVTRQMQTLPVSAIGRVTAWELTG